MDIRSRLYISTVAENAPNLARNNALGLEIAEYCTAFNMDTYFPDTDRTVREEMACADRFTFHMPFNELCPAAIDPLVLEVTRKRHEQALELALSYGVKKMIVHSGFVPLVYHKSWFIDRSVEYWREFFRGKPDDIVLCLENVMEDEPDMLSTIVEQVNDPRFRLCLDVGHAFCVSKEVAVDAWIRRTAPILAHVHIHNNLGEWDTHNALGDGGLDMKSVIDSIAVLAPDATMTIESIDAESSISWLKDKEFI